ncbi:hypothetical protein [Halorhabdus rudnickae]|uniref:hypothetical protein n=1 Tax=Halorhabdus rudnickae TaxID=1775544 RepID=UPI0010836B35|nr:hypothetical protein [Halorhabdus rudnickae]
MAFNEIAGGYMGGDDISVGTDDEDGAEYVLVVSGPDHYETCIRFDEVDQTRNTTDFYRRIRPQAGKRGHRVQTGQIEKVDFGRVGDVLSAIARGENPQP